MPTNMQSKCQVNLSKSKVILRPKFTNSDQDSDITAVENQWQSHNPVWCRFVCTICVVKIGVD